MVLFFIAMWYDNWKNQFKEKSTIDTYCALFECRFAKISIDFAV